MIRAINFLSIVGALCLTTSCTTRTPHENFKLNGAANIGLTLDAAAWTKTPYVKPVKVRTIPNGNTENEYEFRGTCRYFFEFDPKTQVIVGWRFTGSEKDCVIAP